MASWASTILDMNGHTVFLISLLYVRLLVVFLIEILSDKFAFQRGDKITLTLILVLVCLILTFVKFLVQQSFNIYRLS